jgi:CBS domain-containing protein
LNHRVRSLALQQLASAAAVSWIARVTDLADRAIVVRLLELHASRDTSCWCLAGTAGRRESLTRHVPQLLMIANHPGARREFEWMAQALSDCDYLPRTETAFTPEFFVAPAEDWRERYERWMRDPIQNETYRARPLFDLSPLHGGAIEWRQLADLVTAHTDSNFIRLLANDCLSALPPLTFYEDAVLDEAGEQVATFRLERNALQPLVDVGRVFGLASRQVFGTSTQDRFRLARALAPEHNDVFREAASTLDELLWLQGRISIAQATAGSELPPSLLSRHDRQLLKSGFRSIHRLLELTAESQWLHRI